MFHHPAHGVPRFSPMPIPVGAATIHAQGKMEFEFTAPDNAAFYRLQAR